MRQEVAAKIDQIKKEVGKSRKKKLSWKWRKKRKGWMNRVKEKYLQKEMEEIGDQEKERCL